MQAQNREDDSQTSRRLADRFAINSSGRPRIGVRAIASLPWKGPLNLATSTCRRTLNPGGGITEVVELDGDEDGLSEMVTQASTPGDHSEEMEHYDIQLPEAPQFKNYPANHLEVRMLPQISHAPDE